MSYRIPFTNLHLDQCHGLPAIFAVLFFVVLMFIPDRSDLVTYGMFGLEPSVIDSKGQAATLRMDVQWHKPECKLEIQATAWPIEGGHSFPVEGAYTARVKNGQTTVFNKPRKIQMPPLAPGEYLLGFERTDGECPWRPWEKLFPIHNTPPKPFRFVVKPSGNG